MCPIVVAKYKVSSRAARSAGVSPVAERLRSVRLEERFGQQELADRIGVKRTALADYESGRSRIPFTIGLHICRVLDLNPRWLATGAEPKRPHVTLTEVNVNEQALLHSVVARRLDFARCYDLFLKAPFERWFADNPLEKIILTEVTKSRGAVDLAPRLSEIDLVQNALAFTKSASEEERPKMRKCYLDIVTVFLNELRARAEARHYVMPPK
ncbi:MAG: hypothetical protein PCFJNLEI_00316 [Verrucomicrobiae bacterium]|nr:hypothetical protein [Verrucomicrobiae bacterium]